jgi:hypothetical protein
MAAKTILVVSSLLAFAVAAQPAFATDAATYIADASPQRISPPTDPSISDPPPAQPAKRHHRKHARKHRRQQQQQQQQQPPADPQGGGSAPNPG